MTASLPVAAIRCEPHDVVVPPSLHDDVETRPPTSHDTRQTGTTKTDVQNMLTIMQPHCKQTMRLSEIRWCWCWCRLTSGRPELVTEVVLYRRGNVWQCRTGTEKLLATPVSTDDCRRSVVALDPYVELDDDMSLTITVKQGSIRSKVKVTLGQRQN